MRPRVARRMAARQQANADQAGLKLAAWRALNRAQRRELKRRAKKAARARQAGTP